MGPGLSRRHLLRSITAAAGAALGGARMSRAQPPSAAPSPAPPSPPPPPGIPGLIPRRLLFADPDRSVVRISPDGRRLAFLAPVDGVLNLWIAPVTDPATARPVTRVTDRSLGPWLVWLPDSRHVVFFREQGGDENWQAHGIDLKGGTVRALTPGPGVTCYVQQVSHRFPHELLIAHNARDKRFFDIDRVDVSTGRRTLLQQNEGFRSHFTDGHFRVRFALRQLDDGGLEYLKRAAGGGWELFTRVDVADAMATYAIEISDDDAELYWLDSRGRDTAALVAQDMKTGRVRVLAEDARADLGDVFLAPLTLRPMAVAANFARKRWHAVEPAYRRDIAVLDRPAHGDVALVAVSHDQRHWLVHYERHAASGRYVHYDRAAGKTRVLFPSRRALENVPLVAMEPVVVKARDGLSLVCYLSRPRGAPPGPLPMVLLVHGGPWARDVWSFNSNHQWLANRGYAVLSVNYRGSTGFGKAFVNAANLEWAGKMHDDLIDAVDWAIGQGIADPTRVAIYGGSYGGYSALVGLTFTPEKFACAVDLVGISNLMTFLDTIPEYWKPWQSVWKARMGDYTTEAGQRFLQERSPLNRVDRIVRPLLIGHGANDPRVKVSESEQIVTAMRQRGIPVTYVYYADEGHGLRRPENRRSFTAVAEAFLAHHLGGRYEPINDDFKDSTIDFKAGRELIPGLP
jgi:dipeptidyl aminopeptidase/acylaminoacyl peptidase